MDRSAENRTNFDATKKHPGQKDRSALKKPVLPYDSYCCPRFLSMEIFRIIPRDIKFTRRAEPPRLINGSGIPVIGRSPTHIPIFSMK
jgi:hypothetical protein